MKFTIGIVQRGVQPHTACFEDFAVALAAALKELGHEVTDFGPDQGRIIMLGGNNLTGPVPPEAHDAIVFNTEQVASVDRPEHLITNYQKYKDMVVWDYSQANIEALKGLGFKHLVHCPLAYHPSMEVISDAPEQDIDVLFYGSMGQRRKDVLRKLHERGLKVCSIFGVYGKERDAYIARAKIVLNMHFYANPVFEIFRVSHLVANKKCVVSENGGCDAELEDQAELITLSVPYDKLVDACVETIERKQWSAVAAAGNAHFRQTRLTASVMKAIEESTI